jgi:hypothetical protein
MSHRIPYLLPTTLNIFAITTSTLYLRSRLNYNLEEQEARLDEIEGMQELQAAVKSVATGTTLDKVC